MGGGATQRLEETAKTAEEVLGNVFASLGRPDMQMRQAKEVISQLLSDGPAPQREIMDKLRAAGVGESTAKKAKQLMGICSVKQGAMWFWALPDGDGL